MRHVTIFFLFLVTTTCLADTLEGLVVRIVDGDTLVILDATKTQHRVRLAGIDTPEHDQPFGKRATENPARLAGMKPARLEWNKKDRWKRLIGNAMPMNSQRESGRGIRLLCMRPRPRGLGCGVIRILYHPGSGGDGSSNSPLVAHLEGLESQQQALKTDTLNDCLHSEPIIDLESMGPLILLLRFEI